jgi:hypothetical protein
MLSLGFGFWEYWNLFHKVTFDGVNKIIKVNPNETVLDIQIDIYSAWKDWCKVESNLKFVQALNSIGGDPIPGGAVGITFFLENGWKIQPFSEDHILRVTGNLFSRDGSDPFIPPVKNVKATIFSNVSSIVSIAESGISEESSIKIDEVHKLHGLDLSNPLVVTESQRTAGDTIDQTIVETSPGVTTVTRQ